MECEAKGCIETEFIVEFYGIEVCPFHRKAYFMQHLTSNRNRFAKVESGTILDSGKIRYYTDEFKEKSKADKKKSLEVIGSW